VPEVAGDRPTVTSGEAGMFLLEVVGLIGIGRLGWHLGTTTMWSLSLSALFVSVSGAIWGIFRTRGFVPNGSEPVVAIPGALRVAIEYAFYAAGAWGLWVSGWEAASIVLVVGVLLVSFAMRDRLAGLLANRPPQNNV
jgi:hypothetical protein